MAAKYSSISSVINDTELYMSVRNGEVLDLGHLQNVARGRWTWVVDNWSTLKERFKTFVGGNGNLQNALQSLEREVLSYKSGNRQNPFDNNGKFVSFVPLLEIIKITELNLAPQERILVSKETDRISQFTLETFQAMLRLLNQQSALASFRVGLGDKDGARLLGVGSVAKNRPASVTDLSNLSDLEEVRKFIEGVVIDFKGRQDRPPNLIQIANTNLGGNAGHQFSNTYRSAIAVPFEISLESMSKKYLGSADRYFELVTINNLQPPYIDEVGQKFPLLAPGAVNNVIISSQRKNDIPVGTKVSIGSYKVREEPRLIERIVDNGDGTVIMFLSGAQDLSKFKVSEGAFVRIYAPHTVNSGSFVLIPLTIDSPNQSKYTPKSDELRRLEAALLNFGVDILRDEKTGGFVVDSSGNFKFAAGLANVRQAILFALKTSSGELPFHPTYGVTAAIGDKYYGTTDEAVIFANALRRSLLTDPRFQDVQIAGLSATNTGISLTMVVSIVGSSTPIPLSFVS